MLLTSRVAEEFRRRLSLDLPWTTILKVIAAAALVWLWLQLVQLVLVLVVAVLLAVTLDPVMEWFERRGWPRWRAALLIFAALLAAIGGFGWLAWNSVSDQAALAGKHLSHIQQDVVDRVPQWIQDAVGGAGNGEGLSGNVTAWVLGVGRSAVSALVVSVLGLILTMYLSSRAGDPRLGDGVRPEGQARPRQADARGSAACRVRVRRRERADVGACRAVRLRPADDCQGALGFAPRAHRRAVRLRPRARIHRLGDLRGGDGAHRVARRPR